MLQRSAMGPGESNVLAAVSSLLRYPVSHFGTSGENTWCVRASLFPKVAVPPVVMMEMNGENALWSTLIATLVATPGSLGASSRKTTPPLVGAFPVVETRTMPTMRGKDRSSLEDSAAAERGPADAAEVGAGGLLQLKATAAGASPSVVRSACRKRIGIIGGVLGARRNASHVARGRNLRGAVCSPGSCARAGAVQIRRA